MSLDERDYMSEERVRQARYTPRAHRKPPTNDQFWGAVRNGRSPSPGAWLLVVAALGGILFLAYKRDHDRQPASTTYQPTRLVTPSPDAAAPPQRQRIAFPPSGAVRYYGPVDPVGLVSKVTITAAPGHEYRYVVRLRNAATKVLFADAYLAAGQVMELWLPSGPFEAISFMGLQWLDQDRLFADTTQLGMPGAPFESSQGSRYSISLGAPVLLDRSRSR